MEDLDGHLQRTLHSHPLAHNDGCNYVAIIGAQFMDKMKSQAYHYKFYHQWGSHWIDQVHPWGSSIWPSCTTWNVKPWSNGTARSLFMVICRCQTLFIWMILHFIQWLRHDACLISAFESARTPKAGYLTAWWTGHRYPTSALLCGFRTCISASGLFPRTCLRLKHRPNLSHCYTACLPAILCNEYRGHIRWLADAALELSGRGFERHSQDNPIFSSGKSKFPAV